MNLYRYIHAIFFTLIFLYTHSVFSQQSYKYKDILREYDVSLHLFNDRLYPQAREKFELLYQNLSNNSFLLSANNDIILVVQNIQYYIAVSALESNSLDADTLLKHFIGQYYPSVLAHRATYYLGKYHYSNKEYTEALIQFENVSANTLTPEEQAEYDFQKAYCYFIDNDFDRAKKLFANTKDIKNKYYYPSNYYYGFIAYKTGDYEIALDAFYRIADSKKYGRLVPYHISSIYFMQKKYDKMIIYGKQQLANNPFYSNEIVHLMGKSYFEMNDFQSALPYLSEYLLKAEKVAKEDQYQLAYIYYKTGNYDAALDGFKLLNALEDSLGQNALYNMANCYLKLKRKEFARNAFSEAMKFDYDKNIKELSAFNYAKLSAEMEYDDKAINSLESFINEYPSSIFIDDAKELLASLFISSRNYVDAVRVIQTIKEKSPTIKAAYQKVTYYRGVELYNEQEYETAILYFDIANDYPIDLTIQALCYYWKGEYYYQKGLYEEAIENLLRFNNLIKISNQLPQGVSIAMANYTTGYCYYDRAMYDKALIYFSKGYEVMGNDVKDNFKADLLLRMADCYFVEKNYTKAVQSYESVFSKKLQGSDYALFQLGILFGLENNFSKKTEALSGLINEYPTSLYHDDALYELGVSYAHKEQYQKGADYLKQLLNKWPVSNYIPKTLLELGLINYNLNRKEDALNYYKKVVKEYNNTEESKIALQNIKDIYINDGDADTYLQFTKSVQKISSDSEEDSVTYFAAESQYIKGNCEKALSNFKTYLSQFPNGVFTTIVHYYQAECLMKAKRYEEAITDFEYIISLQHNQYTEKALLQAAEISYHILKNQTKAYEYYKKLYETASYKENKQIALLGRLRTSFFTNNFSECIAIANEILAIEPANKDNVTDAHFYSAKSNMVLDSLVQAKRFFLEVIKEADNSKGAEAMFRLAQIYFSQGLLDSSKGYCIDLIKKFPGYDYWVVKSYILIADIYHKSNNTFQAKATLQSIIDNYSGEELLQIAKNKLEAIINEEQQKSKIEIGDEPIIAPMEMDTIK